MIGSWCVRVIFQKIDIEVTKDKDLRKRLLGEMEVNMIGSWCVRVIFQKIDIEVTKDKDLFLTAGLDRISCKYSLTLSR